jgi:hypothetical protein
VPTSPKSPLDVQNGSQNFATRGYRHYLQWRSSDYNAHKTGRAFSDDLASQFHSNIKLMNNSGKLKRGQPMSLALYHALSRVQSFLLVPYIQQ